MAKNQHSRTVLVTGACGYIGSSLCQELLTRGHRVRGLDNLTYGGQSIAGLAANPNFEFVRGDITQTKDVETALAGVTDVIHLAAIVGDIPCQEKPNQAIKVNYHGTRLVAELASKKRVKHFLFASTCSNYGVLNGNVIADENTQLNPISLYAQTKINCERFLLNLGKAKPNFSPVILRFGTGYGMSWRTRFDLLVNSLTYEAKRHGRIVVYGKTAWRPYLHVYDIGRIYAALLEIPHEKVRGQIYNAGWNDQNHQKVELVQAIQTILPSVKAVFAEDYEDRRSYRVDFSKLHKVIKLAPMKRLIDGVREVANYVSYGILTDDNYETNRLKSKTSQLFKKVSKNSNGDNQKPEFIPWARPWITNEEFEGVSEVFDTGWLSMGPMTQQLETTIGKYVGAKHAVAVSNGTVALDVALKALGVGPGDEVICPAHTFVATVSTILYQGATPVFADVELETYNLDPKDIKRCISPKTRCIVYIDYGGNPADYAGIARVAAKHKIPLIQDGAQSFGGAYKGRRLCNQGLVSTTSFHAAKLMTTIEGGMVFTDDASIAQKLRIIRNHGEDPQRKYIHVTLGTNARISDLHAVIGLKQFEKLPTIMKRRAQLAQLYNRLLRDIPGCVLPKTRPGCTNAWFFYPVRIQKEREKVAKELYKRGVDTRIAYPMPVYEQPFFQKYRRRGLSYNCPHAKLFCEEIINLPMFHTLTNEQVTTIANHLKDIINTKRTPAKPNKAKDS